MFEAVAIFGIATIGFGLSTNFLLSLACLYVLGAADMVSVVIRQTLVQAETPDGMRGRVSAVNAVFIGASNELGEFESGAVAALIGTVPSVVVGGVGHAARRCALGAVVPGAAGPGPAGRLRPVRRGILSLRHERPESQAALQSGVALAVAPALAACVGVTGDPLPPIRAPNRRRLGRFGGQSTAEEVTRGLDLTGRTILVTGATSGIGHETAARARAARRACHRHRPHARQERRRRSAGSRAGSRRWRWNSRTGTRSAPAPTDVRGLGIALDALICNAGVMALPVLRTGARHREAVRREPPRALHPGQPAARASEGCARGPRGRCRQPRLPLGARGRHPVRQSLRRPWLRSRVRPTASPSSPITSSRGSSRGGCRAAPPPPTACTRASSSPTSCRNLPEWQQRGAQLVGWAFAKSVGAGRRDLLLRRHRAGARRRQRLFLLRLQSGEAGGAVHGRRCAGGEAVAGFGEVDAGVLFRGIWIRGLRRYPRWLPRAYWVVASVGRFGTRSQPRPSEAWSVTASRAGASRHHPWSPG